MPTPEQLALLATLKAEPERRKAENTKFAYNIWQKATELFPRELDEPYVKQWNENLKYMENVRPFVGGYVQHDGEWQTCTVTLETGYDLLHGHRRAEFSIAIDALGKELVVTNLDDIAKPHQAYILTTDEQGYLIRPKPTRHDMQTFTASFATFTTEPPAALLAA